MRTWLARSSSISAGAAGRRRPSAPRCPGPRSAVPGRLSWLVNLLVGGVELVVHLAELVGELRRQLLQPQAQTLVVAELPAVEPVDALGEAVDQVVDLGQRRAG